MLIWIEDDCSWSRSFTHLATGNLCTTIMHLLRYELYHYQPVSMASPPMAEKDEYTMAHCLDEQTQMISIPRAYTTVYSRASPSHEYVPRISTGI